MRDIFIILFIIGMGLSIFRLPFLATLAYIYIDLVQPQKVSYYLLNSFPISLFFAILAFISFFAFDDRRNMRFGLLQGLIFILLLWVTITTTMSVLPEYAWVKWAWVWKGLAFALLLPCILCTRRRLEAALYMFVFSIMMLVVTGAIKTILGGGGYGALNTFVSNNSGIHESSTLSLLAAMCLPLILHLYKNNIIFPRNILTLLGTIGLAASIPLLIIGIEARTGVLSLALVCFLMYLAGRYKIAIGVAIVVIGSASIPLLPKTFIARMNTIENHQSDGSASTRLKMWKWTWDYANEHPLGGGFSVHRLSRFKVDIVQRQGIGNSTREVKKSYEEKARAFHSSYFEVLGEHGYVGLVIYFAILFTAMFNLIGMMWYKWPEEHRWIGSLARVMLFMLLTFMLGSAFVGIAFQPVFYLFYAMIAALVHLARDAKGVLAENRRRAVIRGRMVTA